MKRIVIDGMGGDYGPYAAVKGACLAMEEFNDLKLTLVGDQNVLEKLLKENGVNNGEIEIIHTDEVITADDSPLNAIKRKKNSSMVVAIDMVKNRQGDCVISAGNTGALMAGGLLRLGRLPGVDRPALTPLIPTVNKDFTVLLDVGANMDASPINLFQFGIMGSIYCEMVLGKKNPKVALLNVGTEPGKGNKTVKEAYDLLSKSELNFIGNLEARDLPFGMADVVICDGFTGNVVLKFMEGLSSAFFLSIKDLISGSIMAKLGGLMLKPSLKSFKNQLDYKEHGGAPFLGVKGVVIKAHGSSDEIAIKNAIRQGNKFLSLGILEKIEASLEKTTGVG